MAAAVSVSSHALLTTLTWYASVLYFLLLPFCPYLLLWHCLHAAFAGVLLNLLNLFTSSQAAAAPAAEEPQASSSAAPAGATAVVRVMTFTELDLSTASADEAAAVLVVRTGVTL